jgi:hypothetical protein
VLCAGAFCNALVVLILREAIRRRANRAAQSSLAFQNELAKKIDQKRKEPPAPSPLQRGYQHHIEQAASQHGAPSD